MGTFKAIGLVKGWARRCAAELYALSPGYLNCLQGRVVILTYHRVVSNKELESEHIQPGMYVTADTFAIPATVFLPTTFVGTAKWFWPEQVAWLCRHRICHSEDERRRVVGILKKKHTWLISVEASMRAGDTEGIIEGCKALQQDQIDTFVAEWAAHLGVVLPGDRQVINWGEAQEMSAAGISFGSHSATHRIMTRLNATELAQEISGSW